MARNRLTAKKRSTKSAERPATESHASRVTIRAPNNDHYPCVISSKWFKSEHGIVQLVDFGRYLAYSKETTGSTFHPEDQVKFVDDLEMDDDSRPFFGYCNPMPETNVRTTLQKERSLTIVKSPWRPFLQCPREGCPHHIDKHFVSLQNLRRHFRQNCRAPGGPLHDCRCQIKCEKYVLDLGPEIPTEGYKQVRYDNVDGQNVRMIRTGWQYKSSQVITGQ